MPTEQLPAFHEMSPFANPPPPPPVDRVDGYEFQGFATLYGCVYCDAQNMTGSEHRTHMQEIHQK